MSTTITEPTGLFWAETGEVTCGAHAPFRGSDTWRSGRWTQMRADDVAQMHIAIDRAPACEVCGATAKGY